MFLGVGIGAFGAHALKSFMSAEGRAVYETGVVYHLVHALALLVVGLLQRVSPHPKLPRIGWLFAAGIALFSGSLYALGVTGIRILGAITPLGGVCFLMGWFFMALQTGKSAVE